MVDMDILTIVLIVAVVLLLVFLVAGKTGPGAGLNINWGLLQTILIIVVLILAAIWLYQQVA